MRYFCPPLRHPGVSSFSHTHGCAWCKKMNCALNEHNFTGLGRSIKHIFAGFTLYNDSCRGKRRFPVLDLKLKKGH